LPAAMSAARAEKPENANVTHATSDTNLRTIKKFPSKNERLRLPPTGNRSLVRSFRAYLL
jgi:hypothetical protein